MKIWKGIQIARYVKYVTKYLYKVCKGVRKDLRYAEDCQVI